MRFILAILFFSVCTELSAQGIYFNYSAGAPPLSKSDSILLSNLPEIKLPDGYDKRELPYKLDNSVYPYFRPIFSQEGASCGQSAGIAYNFTYEMNRLRNLPADTSINQYPSHFTWNFMNGGNGWYGVSYLHSFEILKTLGTPTSYEYGGLYIDDGIAWISGYEKYYAAMKNRIRGVSQIKVNTPEGLETLKYWLDSHLDGSEIGGVANYYAGSPYGFTYLASGTPDSGMAVLPQFLGSNATHAMTIVGYNDSIRFDYNADGQFTNHIDINFDGVVDMKDWEIGGVRFANSYGNTWADSGFCYLMYKVLADDLVDGGIWNHTVHVLDVKEYNEPKLTMRVLLKHDSRDKIKIMAGVSNNTEDIIPEHLIDFPVFNYQGDHYYMQGGREIEENKTIEFGLDITPLLSYVNSGEEAKFFLVVHENDPNNAGSGEVLRYWIVDYNNGTNEILCEDENVPINGNGYTRLSISHAPVFDKVNISTDELPAAVAGESYEVQLEASGGNPDYKWELQTNYYQQSFEADFPQIDENELEPSMPNLDYAKQELEFDFPFYDSTYNQLYVHRSGFIMFEEDLYPWPYFNDPYLLFRSMKCVAGFLSKPLKYYPPPTKGEGMWYEGNENYAAFRWQTTIYHNQNILGEAEFAVILYPDGNIEYYFNEIEVDEDFLWYSGVSLGNKNEFQLIGSANCDILPHWSAYLLTPDLPPGTLSLNSDGLLSGVPEMDEKIYNLTFRVSDDQRISNTKTHQFSDGLIFSYKINAGNDSVVQFGEEVSLDVSVKNIYNSAFQNVEMSIYSNDPHLDILTNQASFGNIGPGDEISLEDALTMQVSSSTPDNYTFLLETNLQSDEADWTGKMFFTSSSPGLFLSDHRIVDDNNNKLDPGETVDIYLNVTNNGSAEGASVFGELFINDPYVTINSPSIQEFGNLKPGESIELAYSVSTDPNTPSIHEANFGFTITANPELSVSESFTYFVGQRPVLVINKAQNSMSSDALLLALEGLDMEHYFSDTLPEHLEHYKSVFLSLGTFYASAPLTTNEGIKLAQYLDNGGNLYMEGAVTWHLDPATAVHPKFHLTKITIPWTNFEQIKGVAGTFTENMIFDYGGDLTMTPYYLEPQSNAFRVFMLDTSTYISGAIAYQNSIFKTIGSMLDFGSLETDNSTIDRELLMKEMLTFFGLGDYFVGIEETKNNSSVSAMVNCYPNPFKYSTSIGFSLEESSLAHIEIYDLSGNLINVPLNKQQLAPGYHIFNWDAKDKWQNTVPPGIYIYQVKLGNNINTGKLVKME